LWFRRNIFVHQPLNSNIHEDDVQVVPEALSILQRAVDSPWCGVIVYWGLYKCGKSTALEQLRINLKRDGRQVYAINGASFERGQNLDGWFLKEMTCFGFLQRVDVHLNKILPRKKAGRASTTIILDHFDTIMKGADHIDVESFLTNLAQQSMSGGQFNVILSTSSATNADRILLWNGGRKIWLPAQPDFSRWKQSSVRALLDGLTKNSATAWKDKNRKELERLGILSGSPSIVRKLFVEGEGSLGNNRQVCLAWDESWKKAITFLKPRYKRL
jgi:hypothetical protein